MQKTIPYYQIRGGSSKGLFFNATDLPTDENERNRLLLLAMEGSTEGDPRQIDGLGGATSLTSKVAIVSKSQNPHADLDYLFVQVVVGKGKVSTTQTCGNILAGVLPFAIETGLILPAHPVTSAKINIKNTGGICEVVLQTPNGQIETKGEAKVDGVVGTAAPIVCNYLETVGATCGALLPTGNVKDMIEGVEATCIDNGMPVVIMEAAAFGLVGNETKETLEANATLKQKIEAIRLKAGPMMNLGDVSAQTIPKMCLISPAQNGGAVNTRMFIPHVVHEAIGVLAAVSVATACLISPLAPDGGTMLDLSMTNHQLQISIEHPTGAFTVNLEYELDNRDALKTSPTTHHALSRSSLRIIKSGVVRTARILSKGEIWIPN